MPKVLVVEDSEYYFDEINHGLENKVEVLHAETLEKGDNLFQSHPDIDLIIMDACVPGDSPNAMWLVRKIVDSGYSRPIIACSSMSSYGEELMHFGATHQSGKYGAASMALRLLNL